MIDEFTNTIVVTCAGKGERLHSDESKCLAPINGEPILKRVIDYWKPRCENWVFVVKPGDSEIEHIAAQCGIRFKIAVQAEPLGSGHAVLCADGFVDEKFTVVLGDCLTAGDFLASDQNFSSGVGVFRQATEPDIKENYGVRISGAAITHAIEKPQSAAGLSCGMGVYFFNRDIFEIISATHHDPAGQIQLTHTLQSWIDRGNSLAAVPFDGVYINVNSRNDIVRAEKFFT